MRFVWGQAVVDENNGLAFEVKVGEASVIVHITVEAEEEKGLPLCKAMAEHRIRSKHLKGKLPKRLHVTSMDFVVAGRGRAG